MMVIMSVTGETNAVFVSEKLRGGSVLIKTNLYDAVWYHSKCDNSQISPILIASDVRRTFTTHDQFHCMNFSCRSGSGTRRCFAWVKPGLSRGAWHLEMPACSISLSTSRSIATERYHLSPGGKVQRGPDKGSQAAPAVRNGLFFTRPQIWLFQQNPDLGEIRCKFVEALFVLYLRDTLLMNQNQ